MRNDGSGLGAGPPGVRIAAPAVDGPFAVVRSGRRRAVGEGVSRVALVISSLAGGGAERIVAGLARHWARAGVRVTVVTLSSRDTDVHALAPGVHRVALDLLRPSRDVVQGALQASRRVRALRGALAAARPEVVVSFLARTNVLSILACRGTGLPVLVSERTDPRHNLVGKTWTAARRLLYPHAAGVVVQTESVATWARAFCPRVHVIPNFVERPSRLAEPRVDRGPRRLVAMGRLGPEKGFDLLIEAFARVAAAHPEWSLTILGEGPQRPALEARVRRARLGQRVSLPGHVLDPLPFLASSHVFALSSRFEGFPNALLEAMACGLPVVAFDCPSGPAEIVADGVNGLLVPRGDVGALAASLSSLMNDPIARARLGLAAREISATLSPGVVLERWSAALRAAKG